MGIEYGEFRRIIELVGITDEVTEYEATLLLATHILELERVSNERAARIEELEAPSDELIEKIRALLKGINETENESDDGWWETSTGADFGHQKLVALIDLVDPPG